MSNPSNAFELLLARANEEARFGTADYVECRDHQVMLNGLPYRAFRQSVRIDERRHQGTFFSGPSIARALAEWIRPLIPTGGMVMRSEEHTSELQSLMRISYAVFCLKKQKQAA